MSTLNEKLPGWNFLARAPHYTNISPLLTFFKWGKCLIASQYTYQITNGWHTHLFRIEAGYTSNVIKIFPVFGCWWISDRSTEKRNKSRQAIQQHLWMVFDTARVLRSYARLHAHFCHTLCNVESLNCSVECAYHLLVHSYKIIQSIFKHIPCRCTCNEVVPIRVVSSAFDTFMSTKNSR